MREEIDIENVLAVGGLFVGQEIEQQGADTGLLKRLRDILIARAQAATAAAMGEQHDPRGALGNNQFALQAHRIGRYQCLASAYVRLLMANVLEHQPCHQNVTPHSRFWRHWDPPLGGKETSLLPEESLS